MNKLDDLFARKKHNILNIYFTAGYPKLESTNDIILALQDAGTDIIELGIPYSDPIADGPVIQLSNMTALSNGIGIKKIFQQLGLIKANLKVPLVLMGYLNPILQYGIENFCKDAANCGVSGLILPDLPMQEFTKIYQPTFKKYNLHFIFLVTPETSEERILKADKLSTGFLYAVSSSSTTGQDNPNYTHTGYFTRLMDMKLKNPFLIGFGIKDKTSFDTACQFAAGAIIGSAFITALGKGEDIKRLTLDFVENIRTGSM